MERFFMPVFVAVVSVFAARAAATLQLDTGKHIYEAACIACHGTNGKGAAASSTVFQRPGTFPDFTRCDQTTPEDNYAWKSVIRDGGPSRGFSQIMPSFRDALTDEQMDKVIHYLRGFCKERGWARGELNFPLALMTEKAFPEDEEVVTSAVNVQHAPGVMSEIIHEQRFGVKNQIEVSVPVDFVHENQTWYGGFGDFGIGWKREIFSNLRTGSILSVEGLVSGPTGSVRHAIGAGTPSFETFASYGQMITANAFLQVQFGSVLPTDTQKAPQSIYWRNALGYSFHQGRGLGRLWSPMVEFVANRDLLDGSKMDWDVIPEMQVTLSKRQHVRAALGYSIPATNTEGRPGQLMMYVLWDWADGKLTEGW